MEPIQGVAEIAGILLDGAAPWLSYAEIVACWDGFAAAICPRRPDTLRRDPAAYDERLNTYLERRGWSDDRIREHVGALIPPAQIDHPRFFERVRISTLRACPDSLIRTMLSNFVRWDPVVQAFEKPKSSREEQEMISRIVRNLGNSAKQVICHKAACRPPLQPHA